MITVTVNGAERSIAAGTTLAVLVGELAPSPKGVAVAVDRAVVPRSAWDAFVVGEGADVEVVSAAAGG